MTGKVLWHVTMSLDGYIAGRGDSMDWMFGYGSPQWAYDIVANIGAILAGRRGFDLFYGQPNGRPYGGGWSGPIFVLTHRPPDTEVEGVVFLSDDLPTAVAKGLAAANGKDLVLFGATIPRDCLVAGLVDEVIIHVAPVLLGGGVRLYDGDETIKLEKVELVESGQLTDFRLRPAT